MIPKSGRQYSEKIVLSQQGERDDDSEKSLPALSGERPVAGLCPPDLLGYFVISGCVAEQRASCSSNPAITARKRPIICSAWTATGDGEAITRRSAA